MIREAVYRLRRVLCGFLASVSRRLWIPPPDIDDICHYAICPSCRLKCETQGWRVQFKQENNEIYEVTFRDAQYDEELKERNRRDGLYV